MKRKFPRAFGAMGVGLLMLATGGCLKDKVTHTYQVQVPVYISLSQARTAIQVTAATTIKYSGKIVLYKDHIFLNEPGLGVHVIDNINPAQPNNTAFINIPGNTDIAIKNDILYADDAFGDLVALDIKDPAHAAVKKYLPQIFNNYFSTGLTLNPDSVQVIAGWQTKDTTVDVSGGTPMLYNYPMATCSGCMSLADGASSLSSGKTNTGTSGSTATFAISNNNLYALSYNSRINVIDIATADDPRYVSPVNLTGYTQTIFAFADKLFLGTTSGVSIYDISDPSNPVIFGQFGHTRSCDPVISDGAHAFVTLRSGTTCEGYTNELDILDITDLSNPKQLIKYPLTNPRGLSKDGNLLFICDGTDGLKIYDASDILSLKKVKIASGMEANDIIAQNGLAVLMATNGIYQFDYSDPQQIHQISKLDINATNQ